MDFVIRLIKIFFTSVVRQVGRDSGKVMSNKMYDDKHHTNIKVKR